VKLPGKTAVVTGARGFLAKNLIPSLQARGWNVIGVSRERRADDSFEIMTWEQFFEGGVDPGSITALFHLAAFIPPNMEDSRYATDCLKTNSILTLNLAEYMAVRGSGRFVYCSGGIIQGYETIPPEEYVHILGLHRAGYYLVSKLLGEVYLERIRKLKGLDAITFRVGSCYGPWMPLASMVSRFVTLAKNGKPLPIRNQGTECYDLVYVDDVVRYLMLGAESEMQGIYNAGSGNSMSVRQVAEAVNIIYENHAGISFEGAITNQIQPGFAPLNMSETSTVFNYTPRNFSDGISDFRIWLESKSKQE